jgi:hypothetical protein
MTTEPPDDQMTFDIPDDFHEPVTEERVAKILNILFVPPQYDKALKLVVLFLKPTDEELPIIENVVKDWCKSVV